MSAIKEALGTPPLKGKFARRFRSARLAAAAASKSDDAPDGPRKRRQEEADDDADEEPRKRVATTQTKQGLGQTKNEQKKENRRRLASADHAEECDDDNASVLSADYAEDADDLEQEKRGRDRQAAGGAKKSKGPADASAGEFKSTMANKLQGLDVDAA